MTFAFPARPGPRWIGPALLGIGGLLAACTEEYVTAPPPAPVAAVVVPAVPAAAVAPGDSCFRTSDIVNHRIGDDHTMYLRTREGGVWRLEMAGSCLAAANADDPIVMREPPGVPYACRAVDLDIAIHHVTGGVNTPCIVDTMQRLTPSEIAALPSSARP